MSSPRPINQTSSGRGVTAILGSTNTGKTHLAIERMTAHSSGIIGLPLRLLAREVYNRVCQKVGITNTALITGEEKITPPNAKFEVYTVEAMPSKTDKAFVALDEVQLGSDFERGHVFTDRIMNLRGFQETLLLGAATVEPVLTKLLPEIEIKKRQRMSILTYAGSKKITRMPARSAIVAFSTNEVYAIAEFIRRQRGGAAVVLGSLSPRTRNAQVELYQNGDVDFLVATDAIGMGLNLDLDHVAFAQDKKFDGFSFRRLKPAEMAQIAGRAGRHTKDGTFGVTGEVNPLSDQLVEQLETHHFEPEKVLMWRNRKLDYSSLDTLKASLDAASANRLLMKTRVATDQAAMETLSQDIIVADLCTSTQMTKLLWDVCSTPDYRKISPGNHSELLGKIFIDLAEHGHVNEDWLAKQIKHCDKTDGDIDALSARLAQIRTWTYLSNRKNWIKDPEHWQNKTRKIEDKLSDALHQSLTKRFIDRRTSVLMKRLRENSMLEAEIKPSGEVIVEGHNVGELHGFRFKPDSSAQGPEAKAANAAVAKVLATEIEKRAGRLAACPNTDIILAKDGSLRWIGEPVAKLTEGETILKPKIILLADEQLTGSNRDSVANRLERWLANHTANILKPLVEMSADQTVTGIARGVAFRLVENLGNIDRREIASDVQSLDQDMRAELRRHGVRFGAYNIFIPLLLKPAPAELLCLLWGIKEGKQEAKGLEEVPTILATGRTSTEFDASFERETYRLCGYRILGQKAVRIDILERLADLIRPILAWKPDTETEKPEGAVDGLSFYVTPAMLSILGATHEDMELVLKGLGYKGEPRLESEIKPENITDKPKEKIADKADGVSTKKTEPAEKTEETSDAETENDEPKKVLIWRYGRSGNSQKNNKRGNSSKFNKGKKGKGFNRTKSTDKNFGKKKAPKEVDPDSPFAKLAALKDTLGSGDGK